MTFGKYRGTPLTETPLSYLAWAWENIDLRGELAEGIWREIRRRTEGDREDAPLNPDRVKRVYRTLALEYHPDRGGPPGVMAGINIFMEALTRELT